MCIRDRCRTDVIASEDVEYGSEVVASDDCEVFTRCAHSRCGNVGSLAMVYVLYGVYGVYGIWVYGTDG